MESSEIKKISDKEHILLRKSMYIGNCSTVDVDKWIISDNELKFTTIKYNEGFFKIINEIIDNSIDEYIKTNGKFSTNIEVYIGDDGTIKVIDNGRGISSKKDVETGKFQTELAFCELKSGSNWDRNESIGMNGLGSSITNIFSKSFKVETCDGKYKTKLVCFNNADDIKTNRRKNSERGTTVEFKIDMNLFEGVEHLNIDLIRNIIFKRLVELKTTYPKIKFKFNGKLIENNIWSYIKFKKFEYSKNVDINMYKVTDSNILDISYVNGLDTYKGGSHLKYIKTEIFKNIKEKIKKKHKIDIRSSLLYNNFIMGLAIRNFSKPEFNTQNKTELINSDKEIKEYFNNLNINIDTISKKIYECFEEDFDYLISTLKNNNIAKKINKVSKDSKNIKKITHFIDALSKNRRDTILFIVEGDSAKSHFPKVRNKEKHGLFQLRGKALNAYNSNLDKVLENREYVNLMNIIGLQLKSKNDSKYFDKIAILTDADVDGDHISTILLLFFYKYFPHLYKEKRIIKVLSPIIIAKKGKNIKRFYDYDEYLNNQSKYEGWSIEYNKGLGSLDESEYSSMINDLKYEVIEIEDVEKTNKVLEILFSKNTSDVRKNWLQGEDLINI